MCSGGAGWCGDGALPTVANMMAVSNIHLQVRGWGGKRWVEWGGMGGNSWWCNGDLLSLWCGRQVCAGNPHKVRTCMSD